MRWTRRSLDPPECDVCGVVKSPSSSVAASVGSQTRPRRCSRSPPDELSPEETAQQLQAGPGELAEIDQAAEENPGCQRQVNRQTPFAHAKASLADPEGLRSC